MGTPPRLLLVVILEIAADCCQLSNSEGLTSRVDSVCVACAKGHFGVVEVGKEGIWVWLREV